MFKKFLQLIIGLLCFLILSGCGRVQTAYWVSFADSYGAGSVVYPKKNFFDFDGNLNVSITKSDDPEWVAGKELKYPYAGIMMKIRKSGKKVDLTGANGISVDYKLVGNISMRFIQEDIPAGEEPRLELSPQKSFGKRTFSWADFDQPDWVDKPIALDISKLTAVMFTNSKEEKSTAQLSIRQIDFPGWNDPQDLLGKVQAMKP